MADMDNWDEVYDQAETQHAPETEPSSEGLSNIPPPTSDIPPQTSDSTAPPPSSTGFAPPSPHAHPAKPTDTSQHAPQDGIPAEAISNGDDLVAQPNATGEEPIEDRVLEETTQITHEAPVADDAVMKDVKPAEDPEFLEAAAAQKGTKDAEWQFDSSGAESSSDDSSSDDSSDSDAGSEEDYEMLDPATLAKILMTGDGEDDEGGASAKKGGKAGDNQPRTANEIKDVEVVKPDVTITPEMKITLLGSVDRVVENMALIKGATPGEYQVLESGSVLCTESREVLGVVADTFGRVQEPLYSIAFTNAQAIKDAGLDFGTEVYYVDEHSTFVFTQPLRNLKGTDASNIHDEEVAEHEAEFSDDEAEAEAKRAKKMAKQAARGGGTTNGRGSGRGGRGRGGAAQSFGAPGHDSGSYNLGDAPAESYGGGMSYDDDEDRPTEFYSPLKRPENLSQLMAGGSAPPPAATRGDRGNVNSRGGRGGGRGDRGNGRGGRGARGGDRGNRGDRGGNRGARSDTRGSHHANSYPDRHNSQQSQPQQQPPIQQHGLPSKPSAPQGALVENPQAAQSYMFGGYQFQFQPQQQPQPPQYPQQPPAGAYVNPAFYPQQQQGAYPQQSWGQQQGYPQQQQQMQNGYAGWRQPQQYPQQGGAQAAGGGQQGMPANLADILRGLNGGAQPPPSG